MSSVPAFKLVEAGFSQPQVEALSEFMQTEAARRSDLQETEHRLDTRIGDVERALAETEHRLDTRIGEVERALAETEHRLDTRIGEVEHRLVTMISGVKTELKTETSGVKAELKADIAEAKADQKATARPHHWMISFNIGLSLLILGKMFLTH